MADTFKDHIAIAVDGGGIKGVVVAYAMIELEKMLGVERLIDEPRLKVMAGTSTGSLISTMIGAGLSGTEMLALYRSVGQRVFSKAGQLRPLGQTVPLLSRWQVPIGLQNALAKVPILGDLLVYSLFPARYSFDPLEALMREKLQEHPSPTDDPTLAEFGEHIGDRTVIITTTEVSDRRTHFLKTLSDERFKDMKLTEAMLASSCIPTYWAPRPLPSDDDTQRYGIDGGVGNYGNPAFVAAWEMCDPRNPDERRHYDPAKTTILSFGTGYEPRDIYRESKGNPRNWWALDWAPRSLDIFSDMSIRGQSRDIVFAYQGIDLRRFQVAQSRSIAADDIKLVDTVLKQMGQEMARLVKENRHALQPDPDLRNDPEGIWHEFLRDYVD